MPITGRLRDGRPYFINEIHKSSDKLRFYTEDGIPIRVIHVSNLPYRISVPNLYQIFEHLGSVTNCYIHFCAEKKKPLFAFIKFRRMCCALRARRSSININNKLLKISPADFWHQEEIDRPYRMATFKKEKKYKVPIEETTDSNDETNSNILSILNEDCLMKIFSYIPLHQLIRSERISKKWLCSVQQYYKYIHKWKTNDWKCNIPLKPLVLQKLFLKFGMYLKILHINQDWSSFNKRTPCLIGKYCFNLVELVVMSLGSYQWKGVLSKCTKLKTLTFEFCNINDQTFQYCKANLEKLTIRDIHDGLIGGFLKNDNFQNLRKLSMLGYQFNENDAIEGVSQLKFLEQLSLSRCLISGDFIYQVIKMLPNLKELSLSFLNVESKYLEPVCELKQLEVLRFHMNSGVTNHLIEKICKNCTKISTLDISVKNKYDLPVVDDKIFPYIWKLKDLENLDVSGLNITDSAFLCLEKSNGSNLRNLSCRNNRNITKCSIIHLITVCPEITKIDVFNCLNLDSKFIELFPVRVDLSQRKKVLHLNMSSQDLPNHLVFPELDLHLQLGNIGDPLFLFSGSDISDSDDENLFLDFFDFDYDDDYDDDNDEFDDDDDDDD